MATQRFESSVTAISWIPSEAITGPSKVPFEAGLTHYDDPPPDRIDDLEALRTSDRFREANELRAFIEVGDGRIVNAGHLGQGHIGATTVKVGPSALRFPAVQLPDIQAEPDGEWVIGPVRPDGRRPDGPADAPAGPPQAVRAVLAVDRVDDARPDHQRRRELEPRARRRESVPAPLDLRRHGDARREVGHGRLREVVQGFVRGSDAVGRAGFAGGHGGRGVGAGAVALEGDHGRRHEAEDQDGRRR